MGRYVGCSFGEAFDGLPDKGSCDVNNTPSSSALWTHSVPHRMFREICQGLWRVWVLHNYHSFTVANRSQKIPRSETKDSLLLIIRVVARISALLPLPWVPVPLGHIRGCDNSSSCNSFCYSFERIPEHGDSKSFIMGRAYAYSFALEEDTVSIFQGCQMDNLYFNIWS